MTLDNLKNVTSRIKDRWGGFDKRYEKKNYKEAAKLYNFPALKTDLEDLIFAVEMYAAKEEGRVHDARYINVCSRMSQV